MPPASPPAAKFQIARRAADKLIFVLSCLLVILPLLYKILQDIFHIPVPDADSLKQNTLFVFGCVSACITWHDDRHISLATLTSKLPGKARNAVGGVRDFAVSAVMVALFFTSASQMFTFYPGGTLLGVPLKAVFTALPVMYLMMFVIHVRRRQAFRGKRVFFILAGVLAGLFVSSGPIAGVCYGVFSAAPALPDTLFAAWCSFAGKAVTPLILLFVLFAFLGAPLFVVLSAVAYIAFSQGGGYVEVLSLEFYSILTDKNIAAIPLFTITGYVLSKGSAGRRLVDIFRAVFGFFRGGTVIAAIVVATFFTTFTGVSGVTILALGSLLTIILTGSGYSKDDAHSLIAASGAIGLLFPPSVAIIMYGTTNYVTVDVYDLFKGAVIPGCLLAAGMVALGCFFDKKKDRPGFSIKATAVAFRESIWELLLPVFICAGFFTGFFDLPESAAFSVLYAVILEVCVRKDYSFKKLFEYIIESIPISGGVLMILASSRGLSFFMLDANIPALLSDWVQAFVSSKIVFLLLLNLMLIIVGCLMDIYSAILVVSPLIIPIAESFGISPVHTGVIFLMNLQLGFLTPPVGMDLFIASYAFDIPVGKVMRGIVPYLIAQAVILLLVTYVPWFSTALVNR